MLVLFLFCLLYASVIIIIVGNMYQEANYDGYKYNNVDYRIKMAETVYNSYA